MLLRLLSVVVIYTLVSVTVHADPISDNAPTEDQKLMYNVAVSANRIYVTNRRGTRRQLSDAALPILSKNVERMNKAFNTGMYALCSTSIRITGLYNTNISCELKTSF